MAQYATYDDLKKIAPERELILWTDDAKTGSVDLNVITRAIEDASDEIDSYAQARYKPPLPATGRIRQVCAQIAVYHLSTRRGQTIPTYRDKYEQARDWPLRLSRGAVSLDEIPTGSADPTGGVEVRGEDREYGMTDSKLEGL